jgi:hypothetical protein
MVAEVHYGMVIRVLVRDFVVVPVEKRGLGEKQASVPVKNAEIWANAASGPALQFVPH